MPEHDDPNYWAKRSFDQQDDRAEKQYVAAIESANQALKGSFLLNGGACIALLAFLSSTYTAQGLSTEKAQLVASIVQSMTWFALGALCSTTASAFAYLANRFYGEAASSFRKSFTHPYIFATPQSSRWGIAANIFNVAGAILGFSSLGLFLYGLILIGRVF